MIHLGYHGIIKHTDGAAFHNTSVNTNLEITYSTLIKNQHIVVSMYIFSTNTYNMYMYMYVKVNQIGAILLKIIAH